MFIHVLANPLNRKLINKSNILVNLCDLYLCCSVESVNWAQAVILRLISSVWESLQAEPDTPRTRYVICCVSLYLVV